MSSNRPNNQPKGLITDSELINQPEQSYRFALNAEATNINSPDSGRKNEEGTKIVTSLPPGSLPVGRLNISDNRIVLFIVSSIDESSSIGIFDSLSETYTEHISDSNAPTGYKLGFKVNAPIDAVYRVRGGCDDVVYFVQKGKPIRYYNFNRKFDFIKEGTDYIDPVKFNLQSVVSTIPTISDIEVKDEGGRILSGSYTFGIQLLDSSLNPTEVVTISKPISIYKDPVDNRFSEIRGSINSEIPELNFGITSKVVKFTVKNLDPNFPYYRIVVTSRNSGDGSVSSVKHTEVISTSQTEFTYTGVEDIYITTREEVLARPTIISSATSINQIDNMLVVGDTEYLNVNYCELQKFASRIKADCISREVILSDSSNPYNSKNPAYEMFGGFYMPGEIYSFGIVYVLEGNVELPALHIPGKPKGDEDIVYSPVYDQEGNLITFPMSTRDNESESSQYTDITSCTSGDFWGLDCNGNPLVGQKVRHHRFPFRSEINRSLIDSSYHDPENIPLNHLDIVINGKLRIYVGDDDDKIHNPNYYAPFNFILRYSLDGNVYETTMNVDPEDYEYYDENSGDYIYYPIRLNLKSEFHSSDDFRDIQVFVEGSSIEGGNLEPKLLHSWERMNSTVTEIDIGQAMTDAVISGSKEVFWSSSQGKTIANESFGLRLSGIEIPPKELTGGKEVIGYYIVRQERTEKDKTILDTAVLLPSVKFRNYIATGLLGPEFKNSDRISKDTFGLLTPSHKFHEIRYSEIDEIIHEGVFKISDRKIGKINYDDVHDGSSYIKSKQKKGNDDGHSPDGSPTSRGYDGWSLNIISRDNVVDYDQRNQIKIPKDDIEEIFYLDALGDKSVNNFQTDVYNLSADNKIGIIRLKTERDLYKRGEFPYVALYKKNLNPYSNFRSAPYIRTSPHMSEISLDSQFQNTNVFGGDVQTSPMRYVNTLFHDNRVAKRVGRRGALKIILGAVATVLGAVLAFFTAGASTPLIGLGITMMGAGILYANSGLKQEAYNKAYAREYDKGLRKTILDDWVDKFYNYKPGLPFGYMGNGRQGTSGPSDDTIQWIGDCISDFWFDTSVKINLRNGFVDDVAPTFLTPCDAIQSGNDSPIGTWEYFKLYYTDSNSPRYPVSKLENYLARKLLGFDPERNDNRYYLGAPLGEYYNINPDFSIGDEDKVFFPIPITYDCCKDCNEENPHRYHYSMQSYQEEQSDNYRFFLPNNYRDLEGDTGRITNIYRLKGNLIIHTEEAIWKVPKNQQERVTDEIVSFIGTGEYFSVPPQKIVEDSSGNSAGLKNKWGALVLEGEIVFISENQRKIFVTDGDKLDSSLNTGISKDLQKLLKVEQDYLYRKLQGHRFPFSNNPSNPYGTGFMIANDPEKNRILFTKRDTILKPSLFSTLEDDYYLCVSGSKLIIFENPQNIIRNKASEGWAYTGIKDCRMQFTREVVRTRREVRYNVTSIPSKSPVVIFYIDAKFSEDQTITLREYAKTWYRDFNPGDSNLTNLIIYTKSHRPWLDSFDHAAGVRNRGNLIAINIRRYDSTYHSGSMLTYPQGGQPTPEYVNHYQIFKDYVVPKWMRPESNSHLDSFKGIVYAIAADENPVGPWVPPPTEPLPPTTHEPDPPLRMFIDPEDYKKSKAFIQHLILAQKGGNYTPEEVHIFPFNYIFTEEDLDESLRPYMLDNILYSDIGGLEDYNVRIVTTRNDIDQGEGSLPTYRDFIWDINRELASMDQNSSGEDPDYIDVPYLAKEYSYVNGRAVQYDSVPKIDNSFTMSFSRSSGWVSYHSYFPNLYLFTPNNLYSWVFKSNSIWEHNIKGLYQKYYGKRKPFILEFVVLRDRVRTKLWDWIMFNTEARKYDENLESYQNRDLITFNKGMFYNDRQNTGVLNLRVKDSTITFEGRTGLENYLPEQVDGLSPGTVIIDKNNEDWFLNELRDAIVDYNRPMFKKAVNQLQNDYFIDKVINEEVINQNVDWKDSKTLKSKYLIVRLIFDSFEDINLLFNFSFEDGYNSVR